MTVSPPEIDASIEIARTIRWRGQRWRILGLDDGFARLVGIARPTKAWASRR